MIKKITLLTFITFLLRYADAQTFVNNGATVAVTQGGVMSVKTDGVTAGSGSLENATAGGLLRNAGVVEIEGSFVNTNGTADGFGTNTGQYRVQGDWSNSATFHADSSTVVLYGSLPQQITSTNGTVTTFYNLVDTNPTPTLVTKTQTLNALVSGTLSIYNSEHATGDNDLVILNTDPAAIVQNTVNNAFVSSTTNGRLVRYTNQQAEYIFPMGINENGAKIREASVTPPSTPSSSPRIYYARYADYPNTTNTTTTDGYDTATKAGSISEVNDVYYHIITSTSTDPATLAIYFDPTTDPMWQSIARWQNVPQWQDLLSCSVVPGQAGSPRLKIARSGWVPSTTDTAYALSDTIAVSVPFAFPNVFVANGQNMPVENTYFGIIDVGGLVTLEDLTIFNRWGEKVFDSNRDGNPNWYGKFQGKLQPEGNYVFRAVVRNNATGKEYPVITGNLSLLW